MARVATLLMDKYQLTMGQVYFKEGRQNEIAYFDAFFRKIPDAGGYAIASGLRNVVDYIKNFKFTDDDIEYLKQEGIFTPEYLNYLKNLKITCDIFALPEGSVVFANEPLATVRGPIIEAQLIETAMLNLLNFSTLIATKASRINYAANGKSVLEFGARRAQGPYAAVEGALDAYIGGCAGTSCMEAGKLYNIKTSGTMAHSFIQSYDSEYEAFKAYAQVYPDTSTFLVDTVDTLRSGVPNAIRVYNEVLKPQGKKLVGIRLDSGDLAYLSKEARRMLDEAGMTETKIVASNALDEKSIQDIIQQGAKIDIFGVGENLITAKSDPVLGGVYKLVALEKNGEIIPKIKFSENAAKTTNPDFKQVYRFIDNKTGYMIADVIARRNEVISEEEYLTTNHENTWLKNKLTDYTLVKLGEQIFKSGKLIYKLPTVKQVREFADSQKAMLWEEVKRLQNPHRYIVNLSDELRELKYKLLEEAGKREPQGSKEVV